MSREHVRLRGQYRHQRHCPVGQLTGAIMHTNRQPSNHNSVIA